MYEQVEKTQDKKSQSVANAVSQRQNSRASTFQFVDNRSEAIQMRKLQELANNSSQVKQLRAFQNRAIASSVAQKKSDVKQGFGFVDNRFEAFSQRKMQDKFTSNSTRQAKTIQPMMKKLNVDKEKYKQMLRSTVYLYAEYDGKEFGIFQTTSGKHAEENLIDAIIKDRLKGGNLTVYLSTSPCSSVFGTRCDGKKGCQEHLESLRRDYGINVNVISDHLYQPQAVGVMERECEFPTGMASFSSAVTSSLDMKFSKLPKAYKDDDLIDGSDVAQL